MATVWNFVTDFGDSAVTAPLALLVLGFLVAAGARRVALGWLLAIGGCAAASGALKLVFGACGSHGAMADIVSPSGHTAMSTVVYGALTLLIGARVTQPWRFALYLAVAIAILAIAFSRLALHNHTAAEVTVGFVVGAVAVMAFRAIIAHQPAPSVPLGWLLLCGGGLVALLHGTRWMIEPTVHRLAWDFRLVLPWCR